MSYDIRVLVKVDGCDKYARIAAPEIDDPTYNLRDMFVACMEWDYEQGKEYRCDDAVKHVARGIEELANNPGEYHRYEPENGWGTLEGAKECLKSLRDCIYEQAEEIPIECLYMRW